MMKIINISNGSELKSVDGKVFEHFFENIKAEDEKEVGLNNSDKNFSPTKTSKMFNSSFRQTGLI